MELTPLEAKMVGLVADAGWSGFVLDGLEVTERTNTGYGRFTTLHDRHAQPLATGVHGPGPLHVEIGGVFVQFVVFANHGVIDFLEIFTVGDDAWDGVERSWRVLDDTRASRSGR